MSRGNNEEEGKAPAEKRRRTDADFGQEGMDDVWEEYTQEVYDYMDVIASQVISQSSNEIITHSQSDTLPVQSEFTMPLQPSSIQKSRSSSASLLSDTSSSSAYPRSTTNSSRSNLSLSSISSHSGSSGGLNQLCTKQEHINRTSSASSAPDLRALQSELEHLRAALKSSKEEECGKDGEIKMLREKLKQAQQDRLEHVQNLNTQRNQKERALKAENEKLNTQLQFKEREYQELQDRLRQMDQQHHKVNSGVPLSQIPASQVTSKAAVSQKSPKKKSSFPTAETFLASDKPETSHSVSMLKDAQTMTRTEVCKTNRRGGTMSLNVRHSEGCVSGPQLVSKLIQTDRGSTKETDESIIGLLQTPTTSVDVRTFLFERDASTFLLSPVRNRRLSDIKTNLQQAEKSEPKQIIPQKFYIMAIRGIQHLLSETVSSTPTSSSVETVDDVATGYLKGPVLILPLLNCYLSHYIDMLSTSSLENIASPSGSGTSLWTSSSESPSSLESLTSSLSLLLMDGQRCANNLEHYCLTSLRTLSKLVSFSSDVRHFLLTGRNGICRSNPTKPRTKETSKKVQHVSMETDLGSVSSGESSLTCSVISVDEFEEMNLLQKVLRLANPGQGQETCTCNPLIVLEALGVFLSLASPLSDLNCERLKPAITQGVINNCFECENFPSIILAAVKLLRHLCHSPQISSSLCTKSESCPLLTMYLLSIKNFEETETVMKIAIYNEVINCICNIACSQGSYVRILLDTDCHCSIEIIQSVITMLCCVLEYYHAVPNDDDLTLLCKGLMLLHQISQHDDQFTDKHQEVQHQYVSLVCGLVSLLKTKSKFYSNEWSALIELWDFPQDDYELLNQDSEEDSTDAKPGCS